MFLIPEKFEKRSCNQLYWAPCGQFIVLAGDAGSLEFIDTNDFLVMNTSEHFKASVVEWDPTGRYVVTAVTMWKTKVFNEILVADIFFHSEMVLNNKAYV